MTASPSRIQPATLRRARRRDQVARWVIMLGGFAVIASVIAILLLIVGVTLPLFGKVHYEGYEAPGYTWQTTGGDDFEPKLSLVPLFSGTLKGTVYAMLFAVPLALFGAVYTAHFTTPGFKRAITVLLPSEY
jgi:ABC-type uncharacterized transport system permease subunit